MGEALRVEHEQKKVSSDEIEDKMKIDGTEDSHHASSPDFPYDISDKDINADKARKGALLPGEDEGLVDKKA